MPVVFAAIIGPPGCGKSTLSSIVAGMLSRSGTRAQVVPLDDFARGHQRTSYHKQWADFAENIKTLARADPPELHVVLLDAPYHKLRQRDVLREIAGGRPVLFFAPAEVVNKSNRGLRRDLAACTFAHSVSLRSAARARDESIENSVFTALHFEGSPDLIAVPFLADTVRAPVPLASIDRALSSSDPATVAAFFRELPGAGFQPLRRDICAIAADILAKISPPSAVVSPATPEPSAPNA